MIARIAVLTLSVSGCLGVSRSGVSVSMPVPASTAIESRTIEYEAPVRGGELTSAQLDSIAPRVRALRADPPDLARAVGDSIRIRDHVRVYALDAAGTVLGELPYYDYGFSGRGWRMLRDGRLVLMRAGTVRVTVRFPEANWKGPPSARPEVPITLRVYEGRP